MRFQTLDLFVKSLPIAALAVSMMMVATVLAFIEDMAGFFSKSQPAVRTAEQTETVIKKSGMK